MATEKKRIEDEIIDNLVKGYKEPEDLIGEGGLLAQLTKRLLERAMSAEMTEHVGYEKHEAAGRNSGNSRNGKTAKTIKGTFGTLPIEVPRDRNGTFEPKIIGKHQTRFTGFDDKIISLYARGLSTREIKQHLEEIYQVEVSPGLISSVTDEVIDEAKAWQDRPLESFYPIVYMDALQFKVRDTGVVRNKAIYLAIGGEHGRDERGPRPVDRPDRGSEVLAASGDRIEEPGIGRHPDRVRRRAQRLPRSDRDGVSAYGGSVVHRAYGAALAQLRRMETAKRSCRRSEKDLHGGDRVRGRNPARGIRREVG